MNQKNSLGIDKCFKDIADPIKLFEEWFNEAKKSEINDPNALALATADKSGFPSVRMVLLKDFNNKGFVFYTNFNSKKSNDLKENQVKRAVDLSAEKYCSASIMLGAAGVAMSHSYEIQ